MRTMATTYLRGLGYDTAVATDYDHAMELLPYNRPDALVVDIQGVPRDQTGSTFATFSNWLASTYRARPPAIVYLLHKGNRRPVLKIDGPLLKKPFPPEALGAAIRECVGRPQTDGQGPGIELDLQTNTLRSVNGEVHLTNIEATLLAYLIAHQGETLHPRSLLVDVWQYHDAAGASTLVRAHISNLRKKLREVHGNANLIQTVRSKGYRFVA